jgi:hypothetical protein
MKCIQHSRHGTIFRMPNEDAHLLVSSGRYVYISKFEARDAALSPRRSWLARIGIFAAAALAIMALLMLTTSAQARPCESLATVQKKHPGQYARYRSVDGHKCWYVGKRVPAKSEFVVAKSNPRAGAKPNLGNTRHEPTPAARGASEGRTVGSIPATGATYDEQINDAFLALCGMPCPQLMAFEDRWEIAMGKQR